MIISEETTNIISFLQETTENKLRKADDLALILEVSATYNGLEELQRLVFLGASIRYIDSTIKKSSQHNEGIDKLYDELQKSLIEFQNILKSYLDHLDEKGKKRFSEIYLEQTQGALRNIIDLSHDFSYLKQIQKAAK